MLLIVGAMPSELRALGGSFPRGQIVQRGDVSVLCTGPGLARAEAAAATLEAARPTRVLHVGFAGGLRGGLGMGDLLVVTETSEQVLAVDAGGQLPGSMPATGIDELRAALALLPIRMGQGALLTVDRFVEDATTKEAIGRAGPYLACEMEAAPLVGACGRVGAAYSGLRAISDPSDVSVMPPPDQAGRLLRWARRPAAALEGWRSVKGFRRATRSLEAALPLAIEALQAMPSIKAPASVTNSSGT